MAKGSKASQDGGPATSARAAPSSDSDNSGGSQSWDKLSPSDDNAPARPNWLLLSVVLNLLLLGACVETYVTRMSVGDVVQRLETVIDVQLEKEVVTPEQYAIIIDAFVRGLPGVDLPPQSTATPLEELYQRYLRDRGLSPEAAEALSNDNPQLAKKLAEQHQARLQRELDGNAEPTPAGVAAAASAAANRAPEPVPRPDASSNQDTPSVVATLSMSVAGKVTPVQVFSGEPTGAAAMRVCSEHVLMVGDCRSIATMMEEQLSAAGVAPVTPPLRLTSPSANSVLKVADDIKVEVASSIGPKEACITLDGRRHFRGQSLWCGSLPTAHTLQLHASKLRVGQHMLVLRPTDKSLAPDVVFFTIEAPRVQVVQLSMTAVAVHVGDYDASVMRVCAHISGSPAGPQLACAARNVDTEPIEEGKVKIIITLPQALHDGAYVLSGIMLSDDGAVLARTSEQTFTVAKSAAPVPAPSLEWLARLPEFDFGMGSKNGEDGILEALARRFGLWNGDTRIAGGYFVEMDYSDPGASPTRFLEQIYSWTGVRFSSTADSITATTAPVYKGVPTSASVNSKLAGAKVPRNIDVLAITGVTEVFMTWDAISAAAYHPRYVVLEVNPAFPPPDARTVPPGTPEWDGETDFYGASLQALVLASEQRGYTLVYVDVTGERAFFVRNEVLAASAGDAAVGPDGSARLRMPASLTPEGLYRQPNMFRSGGGYRAAGNTNWVQVKV